MKKILMGLVVLMVLIIPNFNVYAFEDSFYEGEYIPGEYIKKSRNGSTKYKQLRFFRRESDNQAVYCIELWEEFSSNKKLIGYDYEQYNYANMNYSIWERVMLIAYYGYGYQNHTDSKWYAITQYLIWKETSSDSNVYFTDTLNGNKIEKYQQEIAEINSLIQNHGNIPSFYNQTYQVKYKEPTTIYDTNNELYRFEITGSGGIEVFKNGNSLTFSKDNVGKSPIIFANTGKRFQTSPIVYIDNEGQNLLAPGNYYPIYMVVNVNLPSSNIIVNKFDQDTKNNTPQGDGKLEGTKVQLLDKDNKLVDEKKVQEDGTLTFENIGYGTYFLKEVESGTGYLLNSEVIKLEVDNDIETVNLYNQVIKNEIVLKKYLKNPITASIKNEAGAIFSIYNSKNEKVGTITTNINGIAKTILPYGCYKVKQEFGAKNHSYIEDFEIKITENSMVQTFELYNEELTAKIKVINTDDDSKLSLLEKGAQFKIKDLDTNQYILNQEGNTLILETYDLGSTDFVILSSGRYQIEQIKAVDGYYVNVNTIYFEINDEMIFELDDNQNKYLEIEISNKKQKGQVEINKYIEYYLNNNLVKIEKDTNISIPIYAKEDIYSKDGIKIYTKNQKVEDAVLTNEKVITPLLVFGNYYIKNTADDTIIEIILDKAETQKIKLLDKIYEYKEVLPNENVNDSMSEQTEEILPTENVNDDTSEQTEEILPNENVNDNINEQTEEIEIIVPDTLKNQSILSNLNTLLIGIGLLIIKKEKKYEKN